MVTGATAVGSPGLDERRTIQSVDRALDILEALAGADEMRLNDIARATGLNVSTCHHLIATLAGRGYVAQNPRGRAYFLGNRALALAGSRAHKIDLVHTAMPALRALNQMSGEAVHLDVLRGRELTTLARLESRHAVRVTTEELGKAHAAHATATGKAILAWLPESELSRIVAANGLHAFTEHTITSLDQLVEHLRHVRRNGFALDIEEFQPGAVCVGSAVRDHTGAVIGAISCSMPRMRAGDAEFARIGEQVKTVAAELSVQLGGSEPATDAARRTAA